MVKTNSPNKPLISTLVTSLVLFMVAVITLVTITVFYDDIIVGFGIAIYKFFRYGSMTLIVLSVILAITAFYKEHKRHINFKNAAREKFDRDPLLDEESIIQHLKDVDNTIESTNYHSYASETLSQLAEIRSLHNDFDQIVTDTHLPIMEHIDQQINYAHKIIIQNAKSIHRRLIVEKDSDIIEKKLLENQNLLSDIDSLIIQTISYIDAKDSAKDVELKTLTKYLENLVENYQ